MLFNPGTGTLRSTTVEGALVEAMVMLQIAEEAARLIDETIPNTIAVNYFTGDKTVTLDVGLLPVTSTDTVNGVAYQGANYFNAVPLPAFSNAGSDLLATTLPAAVTELALKLELTVTTDAGATFRVVCDPAKIADFKKLRSKKIYGKEIKSSGLPKTQSNR